MTHEFLEQYGTPPEKYNPLANHPDAERLLLDSLTQGTLLAGREKPFCWELDDITSEGALHRYRAVAEVEALINLAERGPVEIPLSEEEKQALRQLYSKETFDPSIVIRLDHIGYAGKPPLEHDVKSVEVYLGELLTDAGLGRLIPWVHFGMTSEDTNNLAYNLMLRDAANVVIVPAAERLADRLAHLAYVFADTPTLGMTHAQKASPTTIGKQFGYLLANLTSVLEEFDGMRLSGKFSGAVGNHNPMPIIFEGFDYDAYAKEFVESFGFVYAPIQNQRNNHLTVAQYLQTLDRLAVVVGDASDNVWLKILDNSLIQHLVVGEKGSSTMSHKINPWRLENCEALLEQSTALLREAPDGLIKSRHERDLSDHGWQRAYGDMIGRIVASLNYFSVQLDRLTVNQRGTKEALIQSAEVLSELIQTAGRTLEDPHAYERAVEQTQGRNLNLHQVRGIINSTLPHGGIRSRVYDVRPDTYIGTAPDQARAAVAGWHAAKIVLRRGVLDESRSIDAVLFDLDGTLHFGDKDELHARLAAISAGLNSGFTDAEIATFGNRSDFLEMRSLMVAEHNRRNPGNIISEDDFQATNDSISGDYDHLFYAPPGTANIMQILKNSGKDLGLVTTRGNASRDRVLARHDYSRFFNVIVGRGDCERRKPHPQPIALALEILGVKPSRALYVGDLQTDDVAAGNAIGMKTALVNTEPLDKYGPVPTYHWSDLLPLIRLYSR